MAELIKSVRTIRTDNPGYYTYRCVVTENSYNITNNTSNVTITFSIKGPWSSAAFYDYNTYYGIIVDNTVRQTGSSQPYIAGSYVQLLTWTGDIIHNSNGAKSINVGVYLYNGSAGYLPIQYQPNSFLTMGSVALTTIPRTSSYSLSASSVSINGNLTVNITPANANFKHYVRIWTQDFYSYYQEKNNIEKSTTFTIPTSWYGLTNGKSSITAYCRVETYSGSTLIGQAPDQSFTVTVPSNIGPSIGSFTLDPVDINGQNLLIQDKNQLRMTASGCTGGYGSSLSYTITGSNISTQSSSSVTVGPFTSSGTKTYTLTVTDAGGRTAQTTASIQCYAYTAPSFKSFSAYRVASSSSSTASADGEYVRYAYNLNYSSVNSTNKITVKLQYKTGTGSWNTVASDITSSTTTSGSKIIGTFDNTQTYVVRAIVTDSYSGSTSINSTEITIFSAERILNIRPKGKGMAFGKMADKDEVLDSKWPIRSDAPEETMKNLTYKGANVISSTANDTTAKWISKGNLATAYYNTEEQITNQPSQYGFILNLTDGPSGSQVHQLWATQSSGSLFHRGGSSNGWTGSWKTLFDTSNYTSWVSAKPITLYSSSSGTIGTITLSESAANFTYLEIFYTDNNSRQSNSAKIYAPNGKYITLSCVEPATNNSEPRMYIRSSGWTISGTAVTPGRSDLSGDNRGAYGQFYANADGEGVDVKVTASNYIKIFRILGYK